MSSIRWWNGSRPSMRLQDHDLWKRSHVYERGQSSPPDFPSLPLSRHSLTFVLDVVRVSTPQLVWPYSQPQTPSPPTST